MGVFSVARRVHPCPVCLRAVDVPEGGGGASCSGCRHTWRVPPRDLAPRFTPAPSALDEAERRRILETQPDRAHLTADEARELCDGKTSVGPEDGHAIWQRVYAERVQGRGRQEALVHMVEVAGALVADARGLEAMRAMYEATFDYVGEPLRQHAACTMARAAARDGDAASMEAWLGCVDPRSLDLRIDAMRRSALAILALARKKPEEAFTFIGAHEGDLPEGKRHRSGLIVLRAHAYELLERDEEAIAMILDAMRNVGRRGALFFCQGASTWKPMGGLCPRTMPEAAARYFQELNKNNMIVSAAGTAKVAGIMTLVLAVFLGVLGVTSEPGSSSARASWASPRWCSSSACSRSAAPRSACARCAARARARSRRS